ncbi:MAG: beta-propeller domain-containing protein, partial [Porticoccaceae bacterium]|nr:beta-propeller domain-containing protein [Porticoccaceae bacterium]
EAIGKPNEALYGVRFMGDALYLVTFERIDPLYVVDLSKPTDPMIAGELMVTGFSDFLHAVNDDLLMGLGQDENGLVKLELFNVADMTAPYSLGGISLGESEGASWGYSEARYNRHAFTYQAIDASKDRFLIPATISFYSAEMGYQEDNRLYMFEINSKDNAALASIDEIGRISAGREWWQSNVKRSVIHDDAVYYVNGNAVWSALWTNPTEQKGPL